MHGSTNAVGVSDSEGNPRCEDGLAASDWPALALFFTALLAVLAGAWLTVLALYLVTGWTS